MTREDEPDLWNEYIAAANDLYDSMGMACHRETDEVVAFVTAGTVPAIERMNRAAKAICVARGELAAEASS